MEPKSKRRVEQFDEYCYHFTGSGGGNIYRWFMNYFVIGLEVTPQTVHPILHGLVFELEPSYAKSVVNSFLNSYNEQHPQTPWITLSDDDPERQFLSNDRQTCEFFFGATDRYLRYEELTNCLVYGVPCQSNCSFTFSRTFDGISRHYFINEDCDCAEHMNSCHTFFRMRPSETYEGCAYKYADEIPMETFYSEIKELIFH